MMKDIDISVNFQEKLNENTPMNARVKLYVHADSGWPTYTWPVMCKFVE